MNSLEQAKALFFQALEQHTQDRLVEAEALYRQALALAPERVSILTNLGVVLLRLGRAEEAGAFAERALSFEPDCSEARAIRAEAQRYRRGPLAALAEVDAALADTPDQPDLHFQRSSLLAELGRFQEARAASEAGLQLRPAHPPSQTHYALLRASLGELGPAQQLLGQVLAEAPGFLPAGEAWIQLLLRRAVAGEALREEVDPSLLARALDAPWASPRQLLPLACAVLRETPRFRAWLERVEASWPQRLPAHSLADLRFGPALVAQPLLRALLRQPLIGDIGIERLLINVRGWLLERAALSAPDAEWDEALLGFACALAAHGLRAGHVMAESVRDRVHADQLHKRIEAALKNQAAIAAPWLPALLALRPAQDADTLEALRTRRWPPPVQALLDQARASRASSAAEDLSAQALPVLRWTRLPASPRRLVLGDFLAERLSPPPSQPLSALPAPRVLALACGAGEWALELAQRIHGAQVLALDPDPACARASEELAQRLRLPQLQVAQGGLGEAGAGGYTLIDSGRGLLWTIEDVPAALRDVRRWLAPRGLLRIRLPSARLRAALRAARAALQAHGLDPAAELSRAREYLLQLPATDPAASLRALPEFHVQGACRALLCEYDARPLGLGELGQWLEAAGLRLRGFELEPAERHLLAQEARVPADLQAWAGFETRHPQVFQGFYCCWLGLAQPV